MSTDALYWRSRLEGVIYGIATISIVRALIVYKLPKTLKFVSISWLLLILLNVFLSFILKIPLFFFLFILCEEILITIIRLVVLYCYFQRIFTFRIPAWVKVSVSVFYVAVNMTYTFLLVTTIYCDLVTHTCPPGGNDPSKITLFDIINNTFYFVFILMLDIVFMFSISKHLYKTNGLKAVFYRTHLYHLLLQFFTAIFIGLNCYRLFFFYFTDQGALSSIAFYADTFLILSLLDYGISFKDVIRSSTEDTTPQQLETATRNLNTANITKENILRYMHHSLRNSLQKFTYNVDLIKKAVETGSTAEINRRLHVFDIILSYIGTFLDDVQTFDYIQSRKELAMTSSVFDIVKLINEEFMETMNPEQNSEDGAEFVCTDTVHLDLPGVYMVSADVNRMRQLLNILFENYVETRESTFEISIKDDSQLKMMINLETDMDDARSIRELDDIADYRLVSLQILRNIVYSMKGTFDADEGKMTISIPLQKVEMIQVNERKKGCKLLVVDDSSINRKLMKRMIHATLAEGVEEDMIIHESENGQEAIKELETAEKAHEQFDMVFLDVVMPVKDGIETCLEIKRRWQEVLVIMITANDKESLGNIPYDDYIQKPLRASRMQNILGSIGIPTKQ